jgi:hypothetical protein
MNPETFLQYITRKSGMGRTGWFAATLIHAFVVLLLVYSARNHGEHLWWVAGAFGLLILWGYWWGTYGNYRLDRTRTSKPPNQNHYDDVCEGCDPVMYKNRKPITDMTKWYAAVCDLDRAVARKELAAMSAEGYTAIIKQHAAYLAKFPKP